MVMFLIVLLTRRESTSSSSIVSTRKSALSTIVVGLKTTLAPIIAVVSVITITNVRAIGLTVHLIATLALLIVSVMLLKIGIWTILWRARMPSSPTTGMRASGMSSSSTMTSACSIASQRAGTSLRFSVPSVLFELHL